MEHAVVRLRERLKRMFGASAEPFLTSLLSQMGLAAIRTPDDLYAVGDALCARSKETTPLGISLKSNALLLGARAAQPATTQRKLSDMSWMNGGLISLRDAETSQPVEERAPAKKLARPARSSK